MNAERVFCAVLGGVLAASMPGTLAGLVGVFMVGLVAFEYWLTHHNR